MKAGFPKAARTLTIPKTTRDLDETIFSLELQLIGRLPEGAGEEIRTGVAPGNVVQRIERVHAQFKPVLLRAARMRA